MNRCGDCQYFEVIAIGKHGRVKGKCKYSKRMLFKYIQACKKYKENDNEGYRIIADIDR